MKKICLMLLLSSCATVYEKKILQEKDYETWQRDLTLRLSREPENLALEEQLIEIALINEDFPTALRSVKNLQEKKYGNQTQLALHEISILHFAWRLDECLGKIDTFVAENPKSEAAAQLRRQRPVIEKSRTLPPPLKISPYAQKSEAGETFVQLMQAPEIAYFEKDEKEYFADLRSKKEIPENFWKDARVSEPKINEESDAEILHFPNTPEIALQQVKKERENIIFLRSDQREDKLQIPGASDCLLPALSPWGDFLVVSCKRQNHRDLFLFIRENNAWKETALPPGLNTDFDEVSPRISADGRYLFFASNGLPGYGGSDYYYSVINYTKDCKAAPCFNRPAFSLPVNLGPQVNTYHNEIFAFQVSAHHKGLLFSAEGKKTGLVGRAAMPAAIRTTETISYKFVAYSGSNAPPRAITLTPQKNDPRGPVVITSGNQSDWVRLIAGAEYDVAFEAKAGQVLHFRIQVPPAAKNYQLNYIVERFSFETSPEAIHMTYDDDVTKVTQSMHPEVLKIAERLKADSSLNAIVEGHTDNIGGAAYNQGLSDKRAEAVKKQLTALGIAPHRISARGWGELRPLNANANKAEHRANRRVEILVVP